jgi:hypothetical protein
MEFAYEGGGMGKGGTATLYLDGVQIGAGKVAATAAMVFSADDTCDIVRTARSWPRTTRSRTSSPGR